MPHEPFQAYTDFTTISPLGISLRQVPAMKWSHEERIYGKGLCLVRARELIARLPYQHDDMNILEIANNLRDTVQEWLVPTADLGLMPFFCSCASESVRRQWRIKGQFDALPRVARLLRDLAGRSRIDAFKDYPSLKDYAAHTVHLREFSAPLWHTIENLMEPLCFAVNAVLMQEEPVLEDSQACLEANQAIQRAKRAAI